MPSIKIGVDTLALLSPMRRRQGCGHSYDAAIRSLLQKEIDGYDDAAQIGERVKRLEEIATQDHMLLEEILLLLKGGNGDRSTPPPTLNVQ